MHTKILSQNNLSNQRRETMLGNAIQCVLDEMHDILSNALGANNRRQYMHDRGIRGNINWSFALTPTEIIRDKIPANVIGCTGRAKLFCHLAKQHGITCNVVAMAVIPDWRREYDASRGITPNKSNVIINGHQIISVDTPNGPRMFDPGYHKLRFMAESPCINSIVDIGRTHEFIIRAIVPGDKFISMSSYWELDDMYRKGGTYQKIN